jgi:hypothetical protein
MSGNKNKLKMPPIPDASFDPTTKPGVKESGRGRGRGRGRSKGVKLMSINS